ncbi:MAG: hypothetical protein R8P61_32355 [Bacteroidia bacterium]|nr:hypothetical protein [Bacteroidia bacterium]
MKSLFHTAFLICFILIFRSGLAQNILVDEGIQADGLWCFPSYSDTSSYYYLPNRGRLVVNEEGLPAFSFTRYILEKPNQNNSSSTINEADGGGIFSCLFTYDTDPEQIKSAERVLRNKLDNDELTLKAPVLFVEGTYHVISSVLLSAEDRKLELVGTGKAPVMENGQMALSFNLDKLQAQLLLETLKNKTSDVSISFEFVFEGLSAPYNASLEVDWTRVFKSELMGAQARIFVVSAELEKGFSKLRREEAIKFNQVGDNPHMESLVSTAYNKLIDILFDKVPPEQIPQKDPNFNNQGFLSMFQSIAKQYFSVGGVYKKKDIERSGQSTLYFKGRTTVKRNHLISFNLGDLYQKYGSDERFFRDVPLWDAKFQQRKVFMGLDGTTQKELGKMINNVSLVLRKTHANGDESLGQFLINGTNDTSWTYLNKGDEDLEKWMEYDYKVIWDFIGYQADYSSEWFHSKSAKVNLYSPFQRKRIELVGDMDLLKEEGIRRVQVKIKYPFFGETEEKSILIGSNQDLEEKVFEITLPEGVSEVEYSIRWFRSGAAPLQISGSDDTGVLFIDELPNPEQGR